ncbi:hypothetical protein O3W44_21100 [Pantoea sp. LMR881]|uniref:hypothetical protein n=1 Tax=Pantoea sp. LMR881 TaxID=3014336 RepID=UPI0022AEDAE2|nr:hypothetical protein [Pantoea sp. LMR881]MCZ4061047.1 hypothetical protein [Pantoea sp. LMR881]
MALLTSTEHNATSSPGSLGEPGTLNEQDFKLSEAAAKKAFKRILPFIFSLLCRQLSGQNERELCRVGNEQ